MSSLVDELISLNLVRETGLQESQGGRPGTGLELNPVGGSAIGIEIGVDFVSAALTDFTANILWRDRVEFDTKDAAVVITLAERLIDYAYQRSQNLALKLLGIGVGLPGLVNIDAGLLKLAPNLGWHDIPFQKLWENRFGVPVHVANEGSAAALGEYYFGVASSYHNFVYLSVSTVGIGAGIIIDGKLYQGVDGYAGEVGHMVLDPSGPLCACGRYGCWERVAGAQAILKYVVDQVNGGRSTRALDWAGGNTHKLTADMVARAAKEGDQVAYEAITQMCRLFGTGVMNLINTFNPQLIVIGGALSRIIDPFLPLVEGVVNQQAFHALTDNVAVKISLLAEDACVMGAVAAVLDVVFENPSQSVGAFL